MVHNKSRLEYKAQAIKNFADSFSKAPDTNINRQGLFSSQTQIFQDQITKLRNPTPPSLTSSTKEVPETLFDATAEVKILTSTVAMHLEEGIKKKLFSQIDSLHDFDEWDPEDKPLQKASYKSFLRTFLYLRPAKHPGLGLSHTGNIVAVWMTGSNKLTAEFIANDHVKWVISTQNEDGELERVFGNTKIGRFIDSVQPYSPELFFK